MPSFDSFGFNGETSNVDVKPTDDVTDLDTGKTGQLDANGNAVDDITGMVMEMAIMVMLIKINKLHPLRGVKPRILKILMMLMLMSMI